MSGRERVGDVLQPRRGVERAPALLHGLLGALARRPLASQHFAPEQRRDDEDGECGPALVVQLVAVVALREVVEERIGRRRDCDETRDATAGGRREDDRDDVEEPRNDGADAREGEEGDERGCAEGNGQSAAVAHRRARPQGSPRVPARRCVGDQSCSESSLLSCSRSPPATRPSTSRTVSASWRGSNGLTT